MDASSCDSSALASSSSRWRLSCCPTCQLWLRGRPVRSLISDQLRSPFSSLTDSQTSSGTRSRSGCPVLSPQAARASATWRSLAKMPTRAANTRIWSMSWISTW